MFVVKFSGGFANQLFQYSLYLKLTEIYPSIKIYADISHYNICKDHGGFKLGNFIPFHYLHRSIKKTILIDEETFIVTDVKAIQPSKVLLLIAVTELPIVTDVKPVQL